METEREKGMTVKKGSILYAGLKNISTQYRKAPAWVKNNLSVSRKTSKTKTR